MRNNRRSNVSGWLALALPALLPTVALAEPLLLQAAPVPAPATAEVPAAPAPAPNPLIDLSHPDGKILILPFQAVNPNDPAPWMGKSIQNSMVADLTVAAPDRVISTDQPAATLDAALALGKQLGAHFVIAGGYVTVDRELRITGQVLNVDTGKAVAGLKATGDPTQVFRLEDALALQVRGQVLGQNVMPPEQQPLQQNPQPQQELTAQPSVIPNGVFTDNNAAPQYSSYAFAPTPPVYGADSAAYTYYPSYSSGYDPYYYPADYGYYNYPTYGFGPYCGYGYGFGCYPFGFALGFGFGGYGYNHGYYGHGYYGRGSYGGGYRGVYAGGGRTSLGVGIGLSAGVRTSNFSGALSVSPGFARSAARVTTSAAPFRSSVFSPRSSFGRSSSIGGFHATSGFSAHSFGGSSFHGGGGGSFHGGGGGGHGGGHR